MWLIWPRPSASILALGDMKFPNLVDTSLVIPLSRGEDFFMKYINFTHFTPKLPPLGGGGHKIYNFLSPYPTDGTF